MALDHYVSQVHLRQFGCAEIDGRLYVINKRDLRSFQASARNLCRTEQGNTNPYLYNPRAVEKFLKDVEPNYGAALDALRQDRIRPQDVFVLAAFAAYVDCCSPGGMRIHSVPLASSVHSTALLLDKNGEIDRAPASLGGKSLSELLNDGTVKITIDQKYPQAIGVTNLIDRISIFGNSSWDVLINKTMDKPFLTSDFPVTVKQYAPMQIHRCVPLAPDIAIRMYPNPNLSRSAPDLNFPSFSYRRLETSEDDIAETNAEIAQCAESLIMSNIQADWITDLAATFRS